MGKTQTECEECSEVFDPTENPATRKDVVVALGVAGAYVGSSTGLALGPLGAISGTIPGAIAGAGAGTLLSGDYAKCPECDEVQKLG